MGTPTTLNLSGETLSIPPVGADVTCLLAASSFISDFDAVQDPRADQAFVALATAYCNGADLLMPLPHNEVEQIPIFYDLWRRRAAMSTIPEMELSDKAFEELAAPGARAFAQYAEGFPRDVSHWIRFHFTPAIANVYHQRSDIAAIKRCAAEARNLLDNRLIPNVETAIRKVQDEGSVTTPWMYQRFVGTVEFPSFLHLCAAYALSVALRGYSYAVALGRHPRGPLYRHHWLRAPIVNRFDLDAPGTEIVREPAIEFPWGIILRTVFDRNTPLVDRNPEIVAQVLDSIRDHSDQMRTAVKDGVLSNLRSSREAQVTDAEAFVLDILRQAGVSPRYANSNFLQKAVQLLREISKKSSFGCVVELLTANLQPEWSRRLETAYRVRFRRDSFWKVMEDPKIRHALRQLASV